jgi:coenzyme F420-reducing hydrogenase beta subunit
MGSIVKTIVISELLYVTPKVIYYLSTRSHQRNLESRIDRLREKLAAIREKIVENIGDSGCFFCSDVMADNAWISVLALSILSKGFKTIVTIEDKMNAATGIIAFSCVAWAMRFGLCMAFPPLKRYIGFSRGT